MGPPETPPVEDHCPIRSPSYLVTAGVDQLLEHLPVDLPGPGGNGRRARGRARLVGEGHEGPADLAQGILVVVELLRGPELLLPAGRVLAALAVGPPAALGAGAAPVQGLAHQLGRLLQALLDLLEPLARVAHVRGSGESLGPHGLGAQRRRLRRRVEGRRWRARRSLQCVGPEDDFGAG